MLKQALYSTLIASALLLGGCDSDDDDDGGSSDNGNGEMTTGELPAATPGTGNSAYDAIVNNPDLSSLRTAIDVAGLADTLDDESAAFTIFAPDNNAFAAFADANADLNLLAGLLAEDATLAATLAPILTYHVLPSTIDSVAAVDAISNGPVNLVTVNGAELTVGPSDLGAGIAVGDAVVTVPDNGFVSGTSTGVVHVIDSVLVP